MNRIWPGLEQMSVNQRNAMNRSLNALEAMADEWAKEIDLPRIARLLSSGLPTEAFVRRRRRHIDALMRQAFIEGAYRHLLDFPPRDEDR